MNGYKLNVSQLAVCVGVALAAIALFVMPIVWPAIHFDDQLKGALIAIVVAVVNFLFGSSLGSKDKDTVIAELHQRLGQMFDTVLTSNGVSPIVVPAPAPAIAPAPAPAAAPAPAGVSAGSVTVEPDPIPPALLAAFAKQLLPMLSDAQIADAVAKFGALAG